MKLLSWDKFYKELADVFPEAMLDSLEKIDAKVTEKRNDRLTKKNGDQIISVICPHSKVRICLPVKFSECTHPGIFCGLSFVRDSIGAFDFYLIFCKIFHNSKSLAKNTKEAGNAPNMSCMQ